MYINEQFKFMNMESLPKVLNKKDQEVLLKEIQETGSEDAKEKLVLGNLRMCAKIAFKYSYYYDPEDLFEIGVVGLLQSINNFSQEKSDSTNSSWISYAYRSINNNILSFVQRKCKKDNVLVSFECELFTDKDGNTIKLEDSLKDDDILLDQGVVEEEQLYHLQYAINNCLKGKEKSIIKLYYGFGRESMNDEAISQMIGVTRAYVNRLRHSAIKKLRYYMIRYEKNLL